MFSIWAFFEHHKEDVSNLPIPEWLVVIVLFIISPYMVCVIFWAILRFIASETSRFLGGKNS